MSVDVLSDVLSAVRLNGAVYFDFCMSSPWVAEAPPSCEIAGIVMPGAQRVIEYHLIASGTCWGYAVGQEPLRLGEGDLIVFPQGDAHVLASSPTLRAAPELGIYSRSSTPLPMFYELGGGGPERARVVCCFLACDERPFNPLLEALPSVIHLSAADAADGGLATLLSIAVKESATDRSGRDNVLSRLSELIFVETIRRHLETLPAAETGWLAGLRDPIVGRALAALHEAAGHPWTVELLARRANASRSVLAERFTALVGYPPMHYLALWRMQLASRRLIEGRPIAAVAADVGYESEAAFSRAFKKLVGQSPASWRRGNAGDSRPMLPTPRSEASKRRGAPFGAPAEKIAAT